nr:hypothetical protein [Tanacetum cinerariifolium]
MKESLGEDASKQGRIKAIDADEDSTLVNDQDDADKDMFDVNVLGGEDVFTAAAGQNENHVADEAIHKELGDSLVRAATIASSLGAEQDSGNIGKTQSKATPNESSSQGTDSGGGPSQDKYVADILKKFDFSTVKTASTLVEPNKAVVKDVEAEDVDIHLYKSMIGSLMYLTTFRPDITFAICACARDSPFDLEAYFDSDYAGASLDRKSKTGEYVTAANCYGQVLWIQNQMLDYVFNFLNTKIYIDNENETVYKEWEDIMERAATTASSLEAKQDSGNINRTQSMATLNEPLPQETGLGSGPMCQVTMLGVQKLKL